MKKLIGNQLILALAALLLVGFGTAQNATAQIVPVYVVAAKFGVPSDTDAVAESVANYYVSANAIARIRRMGMIVYKIEAPQTTIYPNEDGTFDAVSNGFVWLGPSDFEFEYCCSPASDEISTSTTLLFHK